MAFILQKAFLAHIAAMRGFVFAILAILATVTIGFTPVAASPRDAEQAENVSCSCKLQRRLVRPLTESMPVRKKDKDRMRRILM